MPLALFNNSDKSYYSVSHGTHSPFEVWQEFSPKMKGAMKFVLIKKIRSFRRKTLTTVETARTEPVIHSLRLNRLTSSSSQRLEEVMKAAHAGSKGIQRSQDTTTPHHPAQFFYQVKKESIKDISSSMTRIHCSYYRKSVIFQSCEEVVKLNRERAVKETVA